MRIIFTPNSVSPAEPAMEVSSRKKQLPWSNARDAMDLIMTLPLYTLLTILIGGRAAIATKLMMSH